MHVFVFVWTRVCVGVWLLISQACVCVWTCVSKAQVAEIKSASWSRKRETEERRRERGSFCVCVCVCVCERTLSSSPQNPWRGLPCQSISWSWLQSHPMGRYTHTRPHTHTNLARVTPLWKLRNLTPTHRQTLARVHALSPPVGITARKWQAAAGGVPSLLYRNCSTLGGIPLTLS